MTLPTELPPLIPRPLIYKALDGSFRLTSDTVLVAEEPFFKTLTILAARIQSSTGWKVKTLCREVTPVVESTLSLQYDATLENPEAYTLSVEPQRVTITASSPHGAYYGCMTFLQLLPPAIFSDSPHTNREWEAPSVKISDSPRFRWRGVMLDSCRHFQPPEYIKKFIDLLGQHKINVFHWHLTDDQGWRIEIKKHPRLTQIGSHRRETMIGHCNANNGGNGIPLCGYYTQDEIREIVAYAGERGVHILPEIEMPGHAQAAVAAYPELGLLTDPIEVSCKWGIHETLFNVKPSTLLFLQEVLDEVIQLFPFEYLHIGGDEAVKSQWMHDPETQQRISELGLRDERELQSWFIRQIGAFLQDRGKKLVGWDEILEGGLASGATVMSWQGEQGAIAAAMQGHDAIMCSNNAYYFDYCQSPDSSSEPLCIGGNLPLKTVYQYEPVPAELLPQQAQHIIGIQGQLWTEYIPSTSRLEYMAFPRVAALAEVGWSSKEHPPYFLFINRLRTHLERLDCQDVRYRALREDCDAFIQTED